MSENESSSRRLKERRPVGVSGHQSYSEGWLHGFFNGKEGPVAIVEFDGGHVSEYPAYHIKFLDCDWSPHQVECEHQWSPQQHYTTCVKCSARWYYT